MACAVELEPQAALVGLVERFRKAVATLDAAGVPSGPIYDAEGQPIIVPVLRAGLGMLGPTQDLLPEATVGFIGVRRNEETLLPDAYMSTIPADLDGAPVIVLDPMLATGGSLVYTCEQIVEHNAGRLIVVCVLAAPEGIERFSGAGFAAEIWTAAVDERLNEVGFIVPGLGDAGDRQFGAQ